MEATADVSEISGTVQRDLALILNVLSEFGIHFALFSIVLAKKNFVSFTQNVFYPGTYNGICSYI